MGYQMQNKEVAQSSNLIQERIPKQEYVSILHRKTRLSNLFLMITTMESLLQYLTIQSL